MLIRVLSIVTFEKFIVPALVILPSIVEGELNLTIPFCLFVIIPLIDMPLLNAIIPSLIILPFKPSSEPKLDAPLNSTDAPWIFVNAVSITVLPFSKINWLAL